MSENQSWDFRVRHKNGVLMLNALGDELLQIVILKNNLSTNIGIKKVANTDDEFQITTKDTQMIVKLEADKDT